MHGVDKRSQQPWRESSPVREGCVVVLQAVERFRVRSGSHFQLGRGAYGMTADDGRLITIRPVHRVEKPPAASSPSPPGDEDDVDCRAYN